MGLQMGRSAWIIWQPKGQDTLVAYVLGGEEPMLPGLSTVQGKY